LGFPIYDHEKQGGLYLGERDANGKLITCVLLKECDPSVKPWFSGYTTSWNSMRCFLHLRSVHGVPDLFTHYSLRTIQSNLFSNINNFEKVSTAWHKEHGPATKHWHVVMAGVEPEYQAKGHGKKVMGRLHDLADARDVTCYLECVGTKNQAIYEKLGYTKVAEETLTDPTDETRSLVGTIMIREPKSTAE
jgi:ribosomal protein S18 acetylase RimI-like enzyme